MIGFGVRLKDERKRLKLSAEKFGAAVGVAGNTQYNYEKEERTPDIEYLAKASELGVDTTYVVTGIRSAQVLDVEQQRVLNAWGRIPMAAREWLLSLIDLAADKLSEENQTKNRGLRALPNTSELSIDEPWPLIPDSDMPVLKGECEAVVPLGDAASRIRKVVPNDGGNKSGSGKD